MNKKKGVENFCSFLKKEDMFSAFKKGVILNGDNLTILRKFPDNSIDGVVTDPPYGLSKHPSGEKLNNLLESWVERGFYEVKGKGFMGKEWDKFVPQPILWKEIYRVLKPGGHCLVFCGTRSFDLMGLSLRLAGFEIRDTISWIFGEGFPKSLDISKGIDKINLKKEEYIIRVNKLLAKELSRFSTKEISQKLNCSTRLVNYWKSKERNKERLLPSIKKLDLLKKYNFISISLYKKIKKIILDMKSNNDYLNRTKIGLHPNPASSIFRNNLKERKVFITLPYKEQAKLFEGYGTALKPAQELIIIARKPLSERNIALNVMKWGTGGLNIEGSRIPFKNKEDYKSAKFGKQTDIRGNKYGTNRPSQGNVYAEDVLPNTKGRFPANVILDKESAKMLDEQSGTTKSSGGRSFQTTSKLYGEYANRWQKQDPGYGDVGGASRFFYKAKASKKERYFYCKTCDKVYPMKDFGQHEAHNTVFHPTVKPIELIKYLVKLITPPLEYEPIILDPFLGTGTLGVVCENLKINWIGIEIDENYCKIAKKKIEDFTRKEPKKKKEKRGNFKRISLWS